jgi:glycosyltransferase involved in cell wall biosynthesis
MLRYFSASRVIHGFSQIRFVLDRANADPLRSFRYSPFAASPSSRTPTGEDPVRVTIGLPFFNAETDLQDAIRSVFAQTHQDWELILVDDGSTDRSLDIARSVRDPRVRVVSDGRNLKLAARLNQIADLAQTDIIARMDADDLMPPHRIERQRVALETMPHIDLVSSGVVSIDPQGHPFGARWHFAPTVTREHLLRKTGAGIVHAAVMGRRAWFLRNRYDPLVSIAQDYDLWMRSSARGDLSIHILQEPLYYVREMGSVTPAKMFSAYRMERRTLWSHRRNLWETRFILKSLAKTAVLRLIIAAGRLDWLVRRRSQSVPDEALITKVNDDISIIKGTYVPGL